MSRDGRTAGCREVDRNPESSFRCLQSPVTPDHDFGIPLSGNIMSGGQTLDVSSSNINDQHVHDQFNPSPFPGGRGDLSLCYSLVASITSSAKSADSPAFTALLIVASVASAHRRGACVPILSLRCVTH